MTAGPLNTSTSTTILHAEIGKQAGCRANEHDKQKFEMPARDAQLLDFSLNDIAKRVKALRDIIEDPAATVVRIGGNECA